MKEKTTKSVLCAALGNIIWGLSFLFTKTGLAVAPNPNLMLEQVALIREAFYAKYPDLNWIMGPPAPVLTSMMGCV